MLHLENNLYFCNVIASSPIYNKKTIAILMDKFFLFTLLVSATMVACTPKIKDAGVDYFAQANELKAATETIQLGIKEDIQNLRQERNNLMVQGRTLTEKELTFIDGVNDIIAEQGKLQAYQDDISKSESAYEPNGKELLYLNKQANQLVKQIQKKIAKLKK